MGSDSSHEFGEFMSAVIYIVIFAFAVGFGVILVKDTVNVSYKYDVENYLIINSIIASLKEIAYSNGKYYLDYNELSKKGCFITIENLETCLGINTGKRKYSFSLIINNNEIVKIGNSKIKKRYGFALPVKYENKIYFGKIVIGV